MFKLCLQSIPDCGTKIRNIFLNTGVQNLFFKLLLLQN